MMNLDLDTHFRGSRVPPWLRRFELDPQAALEDLLLGCAQLEHLAMAEPEVLLMRWLETLGPTLVAAVDETLSAWIAESWGNPILPHSGGSAALSSSAWQRAMDLIASEPGLEKSAKVLAEKLPDQRAFLASLREGRSKDPEGRAWFALARHQDPANPHLLGLWWWLIELPADAPWYHGAYGISGLRGLEKNGGFPLRVAEGLARLGRALERRVEEGWLEAKKAEDEFLTVARLTSWAYHFPERWVNFWRSTLPREGEEDRLSDGWVRKLFPQQLKGAQASSPMGKHLRLTAPATTVEEVKSIGAQLNTPADTTVDQARRLLRAQQDYAEATGDTHYVVRTATSFAGRVRRSNSQLALEWAQLARAMDPDHAHAWTTEAQIRLENHEPEAARRIAFEAVRRFPYNDVAHNTLAQTCKALGELAVAEDVYRGTIFRFPANVVSRCGLAELLAGQAGREEEAVNLYRATAARFPENVVCRTGLGDVLRALGRYDEAEAAYEDALAIDSRNSFARHGLDRVKTERHRQGPFDQVAEKASRYRIETAPQTPAPVPGERLDDTGVEILLQDSFLLRHWARERPLAERQDRARTLLVRLTQAGHLDSRAAAEQILLALSANELDEASELLRLAAGRFPGSLRIRYALASTERALALRAGQSSPEAIKAWRKLTRLDARLEPVQCLGESRLLLLESATGDKLADHFGRLGWWTSRILDLEQRAQLDKRNPAPDPFDLSWARELRTHLFADQPIRRAEDIEDLGTLTTNLLANETNLTFQEEIYLHHLTAA